MCRPAQRAMPTDFFRVGPFIIRVGLFIEGFDTCLRVNGKLLPLVGHLRMYRVPVSIRRDSWGWTQPNRVIDWVAIYLPSDAALL